VRGKIGRVGVPARIRVGTAGWAIDPRYLAEIPGIDWRL
jgi:hypothetical protein